MTGCGETMVRKSTSWFIKAVFALGILLTPFSAAGQASNAVPVSGGPVVTQFNTPAVNAPVRVCPVTAIGNPCNTTGVTLYSDYNLTQPINNPTATNAQGIYNAFTTAGFYLIQVQPTLTTTYSYYILESSPGVISINNVGGAFMFVGSGVSCVTTTCTFNGGGGANVTNINLTTHAVQTPGADAIGSVTPYTDARVYGAKIDNATDIGPAVIAAYNSFTGPGDSQTILLPCVGTSGNPGCYWAKPNSFVPSTHYVRFILQGGIRLGSSLAFGPTYDAFASWEGGGGGDNTQFQVGSSVGTFFGPVANGTIGTAIVSSGSAVTITPTFANGAIANLQPGSAITIAENSTSTATAARVANGTGYGLTTLTLATPIRTDPLEILTVTGCSDSSLNIANGSVDAVNYSAQTVSYYQTDATPTTGTGCTVTLFDDDKFESDRVFCSNGVNWTGYSYSCGAGQITIIPNHTHASTAQWGEVAVAMFNDFQGQTWKDISVLEPYGMGFWHEGGTFVEMDNVGVEALQLMTSGVMQQTSTYNNEFHNVSLIALNSGQNVPQCPSGSCVQPSYPYALLCDSDPTGVYYQSYNTGCNSFSIDQGTKIYGGMKIRANGGGVQPSLPALSDVLFEEVAGNAITIDNRTVGSPPVGGIENTNCLSVKNSYVQDNVLAANLYLIGYTDSNAPASGCVVEENANTIGTAALFNPAFNGNATVNGTPYTTQFQLPPNLSAPSGVFNEGNALKGEVEGSGANFSPSVLPFGSLPITLSPATWATLCSSSSNCTVTTVVGPDGPSGAMQAAELDSLTTTGGSITIGTRTGGTYAGDFILYTAWVRPKSGQAFTEGYRGGSGGGFTLVSNGSDTFAPTPQASNSSIATPIAFGTPLAFNGWYPEVALAEIATGESASHNITFNIGPGPATAGGVTYGNQFAQPAWAYIPGPNNPACTAAGTCNLTLDQIEEARQDQYHGMVPPAMPAGVAATGETISAAQYQVLGSPLVTGNLADWTNAGVTNGSVPVWNTGTGKWTPGTVSGGFTNPMTTLGDTMYGGAAGVATRLPGSTSSSTLCLTETGTGSASAAPTWGSCAGSAAVAFSAITGSTNNSGQAMVVGSTSSLDFSGTGTIDANEVGGAAVPASAGFLASNSSNQLVAAAYTPANCTPGTTGSDCLKLSSGLVPVANIPTAIPIANIGSAGLSGTAPVSISSAGAISMHVADASDNGYLASADWSTFNGKQAALSLVAGTYTNGNWCSYASSGTLLNCNNAVPQVNLSLIKGTYVDGDVCTYTASGTLINCNTAPGGAGNMSDGSGTSTPGQFPETTSTLHGYSLNTPATVLAQIGAAPALGFPIAETTSWTLSNTISTIYIFTGSGASTATTPTSVIGFPLTTIWNQGTATVQFFNGGPGLSCEPSSCLIQPGGVGSITVNPAGTAFSAQQSNALALATIGTASNCSSSASPAVCGSAAAGSVALPTNAVSSSIVVNTTAVTANSQILVTTDDTLGTKLGVTCNSTVATLVGGLTISARTAGTSFTIANNVAVVTNPLCVSYAIIN